MYYRYILIGKKANGSVRNPLTPTTLALKPMSELPRDTCFKVKEPKVSVDSKDIYQKYVNIGKFGGVDPSSSDMAIYAQYARYK